MNETTPPRAACSVLRRPFGRTRSCSNTSGLHSTLIAGPPAQCWRTAGKRLCARSRSSVRRFFWPCPEISKLSVGSERYMENHLSFDAVLAQGTQSWLRIPPHYHNLHQRQRRQRVLVLLSPFFYSALIVPVHVLCRRRFRVGRIRSSRAGPGA